MYHQHRPESTIGSTVKVWSFSQDPCVLTELWSNPYLPCLLNLVQLLDIVEILGYTPKKVIRRYLYFYFFCSMTPLMIAVVVKTW